MRNEAFVGLTLNKRRLTGRTHHQPTDMVF